MKFGERVRSLRKAKDLSLRDLAEQVGVTHTYLSKIENQKLDFGEYPSEALIHKLAHSLDGDENELLILAEKIPEKIRQLFQRFPETFLNLADVTHRRQKKIISELDARLSEKAR